MSHNLHFGPYRYSVEERLLYRGDELVPLAPKILETLHILIERRGRIVEKNTLMDRLWPETAVGEDSLLRNISLLRKTLCGGEDDCRFIETIPKRGYRFVASVVTDSQKYPVARKIALTAAPPAAEPAAPATTSPHLRLALALLGLLAISAAVYFAWRPAGRAAAPRLEKAVLVVLPFQNLTGDPDQEYFADGLTEEMTTHLASLDPVRLGVIARTSALRYKGTQKSIAEIGRELAAQYVLEGSVRREAGGYRIVAQLVETAGQTHVFARTYDRGLRDLLKLQNDVAAAVAGEVKLALASAPPVASRRRAANQQAYDAYWRGRFYWHQRSPDAVRKGLAYFEEALLADPGYALAHVGVADSYHLLAVYGMPPREALPLAKQAARAALALEPHLAEAHASLAYASFRHDLDWLAAEAGFRRAIQLDPGNATARQWLAELLAALGRHDEAAAEIQQARELEPLSLAIQVDVGRLAYFAGRYQQAVRDVERALEANPEQNWPRLFLALAFVKRKQFDAAAAQAEILAGPQRARPLLLAYVLAAAGRRSEARALLQRAPAQPADLLFAAAVHAELGELEQATALLEKARDQGSTFVPLLKAHPMLEPLRGHPRFVRLLASLNFPPA